MFTRCFPMIRLRSHSLPTLPYASSFQTNLCPVLIWRQSKSACAQGSRLTSYTTLWTVVGEWTTASTDCARYLNGRGIGARYDGTFPGSPFVGSCQGLTGNRNTFSSSYKTFLRQYYEAQVSSRCFGILDLVLSPFAPEQISSYEQAQGWIFW